MELIADLRDTHNFSTSTTNNLLLKMNSFKFGNQIVKVMDSFAINVITRTKNKNSLIFDLHLLVHEPRRELSFPYVFS